MFFTTSRFINKDAFAGPRTLLRENRLAVAGNRFSEKLPKREPELGKRRDLVARAGRDGPLP
jgi:hypothetical protein